MSKVFEELGSLNRLVHEPARLTVLTALSFCKKADFLFLKRITGLTPGNLSSHLYKLEKAGLIKIEKQILAKHINTQISITDIGLSMINQHWKKLEDLYKEAKNFKIDN